MGVLLSACGGGGGGGGGGTPGSQGQFSISPASLTFEATNSESASMPPMRITGTISGISPQTLFINARITGPAVSSVSDFAVSSSATGIANVYPAPPRDLGPGSYNSVITVTACTTSVACTSGVIGTPQTVNVTYNIHGLRSSPASLTYSIGNTNAPSDLVRTFDVSGWPAQNWTASASVPWLIVSPTSSTAGATTRVTASLVPAELAILGSGAHTGYIRLQPTVGVAVDVPVTMNITRERVNFVAPYVALTGTEGDVIIRGENLTRYPITAVRFGGTDAVSYTVVSDTEIRARHPVLAAGSYEVNIVNGQTAGTRAALQVIPPKNYSVTVFDYSSAGASLAVCLVHDAERDSLLVAARPDTGPTQLYRYSLAAGGSVAATATFSQMRACAFTADGRRLMVNSFEPPVGSGFMLSELNPTTLFAEVRAPISSELRGMASANNGQIVIATDPAGLLQYSQLRHLFGAFTPSYSVTTGRLAASRDGSIVLAIDGNSGVVSYDASTGQLTLPPVSSPFIADAVDLDRTGERALFDNTRVYSRDFQLLGSLPGSTRVAAFSPSGQRAYAYDQNGTVRTFDLTAATAGSFAEILPAIAVPQSPANTSNRLRMLVSHDERAVFIAGDARALVIPLP
ncbi:MAG TPA: IPT/TIG domain-containing protein [Steroidobacter sp.]